MAKDPDLIRRILLAAQETNGHLHGIEGVNRETFAKHVRFLEDDGFVKAAILPGDQKATVRRLTSSGEDFASAAAKSDLWEKTKKHVIATGVRWTARAFFEYLKAEIASKFTGGD